MLESAQEIFDYLPLRMSEPESRYIRHLWDTFEHLSSSENPDTRAFAVAPFHLLFMLALQYRALRLYRRRGEEYVICKTIVDLEPRRRKAQAPTSVFDLALISESPLADVFPIIGVSTGDVVAIKKLVRERNDGFAHAKGAIEEDIERRVEEYLTVLRNIGPSFEVMNTEVATEWLTELTPEDDRDTYVEIRVASEYLCPIDFSVGPLHDEFAAMFGLESST